MNLLSSFTIILQNLNTHASCNIETTVETAHVARCHMPLKALYYCMFSGGQVSWFRTGYEADMHCKCI
jgi:hypothetical protein